MPMKLTSFLLAVIALTAGCSSAPDYPGDWISVSDSLDVVHIHDLGHYYIVHFHRGSKLVGHLDSGVLNVEFNGAKAQLIIDEQDQLIIDGNGAVVFGYEVYKRLE
jgi:hypothetical protein